MTVDECIYEDDFDVDILQSQTCRYIVTIYMYAFLTELRGLWQGSISVVRLLAVMALRLWSHFASVALISLKCLSVCPPAARPPTAPLLQCQHGE